MDTAAAPSCGARGARSNAFLVSALALLLTVLCLGAPSVAAAATATPTPTGAGTGPRTASYAAAAGLLTWGACGGRFQCARLQVPLDYRNPTGTRISLALIRLPASDQARRVGSLFVDPGGPGDSGVDFVRRHAIDTFAPSVLAAFDIIGFDPRGVGRSTPLRCFDTQGEESDVFAGVPVFPVNRREEHLTEVANARLASACARRPLAAHVTTAEVARDLDRMRAAVGDRQMSYVGYSYGTYLGTVYANLYPRHLRAMVADGVIDPRHWVGTGAEAARVPVDVRLQSDRGTSASLRAFLRACDRHPASCRFAAGGPLTSTAKFTRLMRTLHTRPITTRTNGTQTYAEVVSSVRFQLYDTDSWTRLGRDLQALWRHRHDQAGSRAAPPAPTPRPLGERAARRSGYDNYLDIAEAVTCGDSRNPASPAAWERYGPLRDEVAPYFGRFWTWLDQACATWPTSPTRYRGPFDRRAVPPALVVGNLRDPATRYQDAVSLAHLLPRARLLTVRGTGHTSRGVHSSCVQQITADYLLHHRLPNPGTTCEPDEPPFG